MRACALVLCVAVAACEGPRGPAGEAGERGQRGETGNDGKPGKNGADGADGEDGARGLPGARGPAGETGPRGPAGPAGGDADGGAGRGYGPGLWIACTGLLDLIGAGGTLGTDGTPETLLDYRVTAFVGQDVDVQCATGKGGESASGGGYFPATTAGANTAACLTGNDYPPTGTEAGFWKYEIVHGSGPRATYNDLDVGHPLAGDFYAFTESDCTVLVNDGDAWEASTLADVF